MAATKEFKEDFILFAEAGFIAINQLDEESAKTLFKAAEMLDSKNVLPKVGRGYLCLHKLELKEAVELFDEALKSDPKNEMANTFKAIAMMMTPNHVEDAEKILSMTGKSDDKEIKNLSATALEFVDRFVKKHPSPAEGKKKQK